MNRNFTLIKPPALKSINPLRRFIYFCCCIISVLTIDNAYAQDGQLADDFSTGNTFSWVPATSGSTASFVNGRYTIKMALQTGGKYRGDLRKNGGVTFHAGTFPIVAIKFDKPPRANFFFDTNLGAFNNTNNNATKVVTPTGNIYYWDLSTGKLGTTTLSKTQATTLSTFQFKLADVVLTQEELAANDISYEVDWVRTFSSVDALRNFADPTGATPPQFEFTGEFSHPGLLHNTADLLRIKNQVANKYGRAYKSYELLVASNKSSSSYSKAGPFRLLTRDQAITVDGVAGGSVKDGVERDFLAAYYNALMWNITNNDLHAKKAIEIIDAYASTTTAIVGADAELNGLYGFMLANAAEIMRSTYPAWEASNILQCQNMLKSVFYPVIGNFRPCAHGNWDIICMKALMSIAIFTDDKPMFNKTINYYYYGEGNGSIDNYVLTEAGQLQESNRDQPHTMLALGSLAELAEMALKQGVDLYSASNNAIMRGYEYTSKYNLGYTVPYETSYDFCEKNYQDYTPEAISAVGRGGFRAVFEIAYNHYVFRKGLAMPSTYEVLGKMGPEGAPFGADNPGYGSLFFYLNPEPDYQFSGVLDDNFTSSPDSWIAATSGSSVSAVNGELNVSLVTQSTGKGRGDVKKNGSVELNTNNYPILAIKMKKPLVANVTFDTNLGAYGNGANKWTGKVGDDIYYYDLTKNFGLDKFLSTTGSTMLTTFQFKIADVSSGETSYQIDWVKTVKNIDDLVALNPTAGLVSDNFSNSTDNWSVNTTGASLTSENDNLRVTLAKQTNGSGRGDIKRNAGAVLYPVNYPIVAIKLKKPKTGNVTFDTSLGSFGNGSNKWTGKVGDDIYYYDMSKTGFGSAGTLLTKPTTLSLFQFKVADITSGETNYQVDWVKTVKSVNDLQALIAPAYQTISFQALDTMKVGAEDFSPAVSSSGLNVTYSSSNENTATVIDGKIRIVGAGTSEITATQRGNAEYFIADAVKRTLIVVKNSQTISFSPLADKKVGDEDFEPQASATSLLPVTYSSSDSSVAIILNGKIHLIGGGSTTITASQSGDYKFLAASPVSQALNVFVPPLVKAKNITIELDATGAAVITPADIDNGSESYNGVLNLTADKLSFNCSDIGPPVNVLLTGTDAKGYSNSVIAEVTVADNLKPVLVAPSSQSFCFAGSTYTVPALVASDNCGIASIVYSVNGATSRNGTGADVSGEFNTGVSIINWTATDIHGNISNAEVTLTVNPQLSSNIPDVYAMNSQTDEKNTIYLGYGPSSLTVNALPEGGSAPYSYLWNTGELTQSINVNTEGAYSVVITDAKGCQTSSSIQINVLDVRCGNSNDKVQVCHNGQTICVAQSAVQTHLEHGDKLGSCAPVASLSMAPVSMKLDETSDIAISVYPNPVSENLSMKIDKLQAGATAKLFDINGAEVISQQITSSPQVLSVIGLSKGLYIIRIKNGAETMTSKIIVQ